MASAFQATVGAPQPLRFSEPFPQDAWNGLQRPTLRVGSRNPHENGLTIESPLLNTDAERSSKLSARLNYV